MNKAFQRHLCCSLLSAFVAVSAFGSHMTDAMPKPKVIPDFDNPAPEADTSWSTVDVKGFDTVRLHESADFSKYQNVIVEMPSLEFDPNWLRDYKGQMSKRDKTRIELSYAGALKAALEQSLEKKLGWKIVQEPTSDTLVITPKLTRFRLNAPDLAFRGKTRDFVSYAGSAILGLQLKDGTTQQSLAELSDFSQTRAFGGVGDLKPTNRAENLRDFKMLSQRWASRLGDYLANTSSQ